MAWCDITVKRLLVHTITQKSHCLTYIIYKFSVDVLSPFIQSHVRAFDHPNCRHVIFEKILIRRPSPTENPHFYTIVSASKYKWWLDVLHFIEELGQEGGAS